MTEIRDLELQRNATLTLEFEVQDATGTALDITGDTFKLDVKARAGDADPPLASATIAVLDAPTGLISIYLEGSDFSAVAGAFETVRLAYDLIGTIDGKDVPLMRGTLLLVPGVS